VRIIMKPQTLVAAAALALAQPAAAQSGGLIIDRNRPDRAPAGAAAPRDQPGPRLAGAGTVEATITPFVLKAVRVEGSTAPAAALEAATRPLVGRTVDAQALARIVQAVADAYARTDIALYTVVAPRQDFADGVVRLRVIEGWISEAAIHVTGPSKVTAPLKAYAARLTTEKPLRRRTLERYLSLIRDLPGLDVQADLQRTDTPGAVRLALEGKQKPFEMGLAVNTRGTSYLGRTQFTATADAYDLLRGGDHTQIVFAVPSDLRRFQYYGLSHSQLLNAEGTTLQASAAYLRTRPRGVAALTGDAWLAGLQVAHPLVRRYDRSLYLTAGIDGLNASNALLGQSIADERTRVLRAALAYGRTGAETAFSVSGTVSLGLSGLGARVVDLRGAEARFLKLSGRAALDQALGKTLALRLRATGQYSGRRLPASEMLALGGDQFGRAFEAAVLTGDYGYAGSAELAWRAKPLPKALAGSEIYGFVDAGAVWFRDLVLPTQRLTLASAGGGVRAAIASKAVVQVEAARAIDDPLPFRRGRAWRVVASVRGRF
jgi:hemolysin activation/secretion protein